MKKKVKKNVVPKAAESAVWVCCKVNDRISAVSKLDKSPHV
jgi:hypothetical protein